MPTDYTNIIYNEIMENLANLINGEFSIPIYYDEHKGNQSFVITPQSDSLVTKLSTGSQREYEILISYQLKTGGQYTKNNLNQVSQIMERMKRLIHNNSHYSPSGVYKYHDGRVESVNYEQDEDNLDIWRANVSFNCTVTEIYT